MLTYQVFPPLTHKSGSLSQLSLVLKSKRERVSGMDYGRRYLRWIDCVCRETGERGTPEHP